MPKLIMLKSLPAAGKTTWCKNYIKDHPNTVRINNDDLRRSLFVGNFNFKVHEQIITQQRNFILESILSEQKFNVIIDNLNLHPKHKKFYRELSDRYNYEFEVITIDTPLEECIKRDRERNKEEQVGEKVIRQWYRNFMYKEPFKLEQDNNLPHAIICDLDGTLSLFGNKNPYDRDFENDILNIEIANLLELYSKMGTKIILVSGRDSKYREQTQEFLRKNNVYYNELLMRSTNDNRPDEVIKLEIFNNCIKDKYYIRFILDDRKKVKRMWVNLGLFVLDANQTDEEF